MKRVGGRRRITAKEAQERLEYRLRHGRKKTSFSRPEKLLKGFWAKAGVKEDRIAILHAVWKREVGAYARHWELDAVRRGTVYVKVRSSASGQELALRSRELARNINKHFQKAWVRAIRFKVG